MLIQDVKLEVRNGNSNHASRSCVQIGCSERTIGDMHRRFCDADQLRESIPMALKPALSFATQRFPEDDQTQPQILLYIPKDALPGSVAGRLKEFG